MLIFHFAQNMRKHLGTIGKMTHYNKHLQFALSARMVTSVSFIPTQDLEEAFSDNLPDEPQPILTKKSLEISLEYLSICLLYFYIAILILFLSYRQGKKTSFVIFLSNVERT